MADTAERYAVGLDFFEGPIDLLLYLIRRDEIDIYDIPIAHITKQYQEYLERAMTLDLDIAGEYLVIAAMLVRMKAAMLLPSRSKGGFTDVDDPRQELVDMLVDYTRYRRVGEVLERRLIDRAGFFPRGHIEPISSEHSLPAMPMDLYQLMEVAWRLLRSEKRVVAPQGEVVRLQDRIHAVKKSISGKKRLRFTDIFEGETISPLLFVVTFFAMLELIRQGILRVRQHSPFGQIWVYPVEVS